MFEIGIFCVILLAAGYWTTMFVMGRRDDVIHGKFVHAEAGPEVAAAPVMPPFPSRPKFPPRPTPRVANDTKSVNSDALQSLLAAIQQDLKNVA
ncbi:hypothetical protein C2U70_05730 [Bradyrhizobium guangdongense]|uniref:hypothetical protein n=1 Tax=Bradyrhizobium guangdongense TaxID=1325090 RepID=UPI00112E5A2B|nr:hypothetical protein [Bradyrhizobium guangdongense]TPQ40125.1 hypothetical protein C2U70_05730 [Bradyrhizobium guangdongense]